MKRLFKKETLRAVARKLRLSLRSRVTGLLSFWSPKGDRISLQDDRRIAQAGFIKITKKTIILIFCLWLIFTSAGLLYFFGPWTKKAQAAWMDESWFYRTPLTVTVASNSSDITSLDTLVTLDTSTLITNSKLQSDCDDLRFTNTNGDLLPYYIDSGCNTTTTKIWVRADLVPKSTTTYNLYVYYGNPSATPGSDVNQFKLYQGLVGYWPMNEASWNGTSGEVKDTSVNSNNGTAAGNATTTASGKYSYGATLDGTGDHITTANTTLLSNVTTGTITAWVKTNTLGTLVGAGTTRVVSDGWAELGYDDSFQPRFDLYNGSTYAITSTSTINDNTWHHLAVTWGASDGMKLYLDGVVIGSDPSTAGTGNRNLAPYIGSRNANDNWRNVNGSMDDTRIYNRALSSVEVTQVYNTPGNITTTSTTTSKPTTASGTEEKGPGPVAYWSLDEGQGQTTYDSSSNKNNGTLGATSGSSTDDPTWTTEDQCVSGKCLKFDGTDDYMNAGNSSSLQFERTDSFTINAWFKTQSTNQQAIVAKTEGASPYRGYEMVYYLNKVRVYIRNTANTNEIIVDSGTNLNQNTWYHLAFTYDGSSSANGVKIYINGVLDQSTITANTLSSTIANSENVRIGSIGSTVIAAKGFIDEPKIYNYARTAAQIKADYNSRGVTKGTSLGSRSHALDGALSDGLVAWWKMDESTANTCTGGVNDSCDSSGNSNNGAWNGNATSGAGKFGNAVNLDGTDDFVDAGSFTSIDGVSQVTIAFWGNRSATTNRLSVGKRNSSAGNGPSTLINVWGDGNIYWNLNDTSASANYGSSSFSGTGWHQFVMVFDGSQAAANRLKGYVDGIQQTLTITGTIPTTTGTNISNFFMGKDNFNTPMSTGTIDDARIYNRALAPAEVRDLYNFAPGPVGYWKMDDKVSGNSKTVVDSSGNGNNGTTSSANGTGMDCIKNPGKYGGGCELDGTDDYVAVADSSSLNPTSAISFSAWAKPTTIPAGTSYSFIGKKTDGTASTNQYALVLSGPDCSNTTRFAFAVWIGSTPTVVCATNTTPTANTWYHVMGAYDGSTIKIYINGKLDNSASLTGSIDTATGAFHIGRNNANGSELYWNGLIDDVKIYNYARTPAQIQEDMAGTSALIRSSSARIPVAYWDFDEGYSTTANNKGNGGSTLNGTLTNMASPATSTSGWTQSGKFGKALNFDGSNDTVTVTDSTSVQFGTGDFSTSAWVYPRTVSYGLNDQGTIVSKDYTGFELFIYQGNLNAYLGGTSNSLTGVKTLSTNTWYHVVLTRSGSSVKTYINGVQDSSVTNSASVSNVGTNLSLGQRTGSTTFALDGLLDDVKIYNYALTSEEILTDYNNGSSLIMGALGSNSSYQSNASNQEYCIPGDSSTCTAPVGRWDFEEGNGGSVYDTSGNMHTGSFTGSPTWTSGKYGKALKLDTTPSYVKVPTSSDFAFGTGDFTLSYWVYLTAYSSTGNTLSDFRDGTNGAYWADQINSNHKYIAYVNSATLLTSSASIPLTTWTHIEVSRSGTSLKVYINGVLDTTVTDSTNYSAPAANVWLGISSMSTQQTAAFSLNGRIDNIHIFKYARSAAQIAWDYNKGAPIAHYDFDECQGTTIYDQSPNKNNGTLTLGASGQTAPGTCSTNASTPWYSGRSGKLNYSLNFDGEDDYVETGAVTAFNTIGTSGYGYSMAAWVKIPTSAQAQINPGIISKGTTNDVAQIIYGTGGGNGLTLGTISFHQWNGTTQKDVTSTTTYNDNQWHHVVATSDGTTLFLYIDGKFINSTAASGSFLTNANGTIRFGGRRDVTARVINGQIDEVKIYNYALTPLQVKLLYNNGSINFSPTTGSP